ncbi:MAG: hypothetical protein ACO3JL_12600, partial [Myxococcota bacterium]
VTPSCEPFVFHHEQSRETTTTATAPWLWHGRHSDPMPAGTARALFDRPAGIEHVEDQGSVEDVCHISERGVLSLAPFSIAAWSR